MKRFILLAFASCLFLSLSSCTRKLYNPANEVTYKVRDYRTNQREMTFTSSHSFVIGIITAEQKIIAEKEKAREKVIQEALEWRQQQPQQYHTYTTQTNVTIGLLKATVYATCDITVYDIKTEIVGVAR